MVCEIRFGRLEGPPGVCDLLVFRRNGDGGVFDGGPGKGELTFRFLYMIRLRKGDPGATASRHIPGRYSGNIVRPDRSSTWRRREGLEFRLLFFQKGLEAIP